MEGERNVLPDWMIFIGKWGNKNEGHPLVYHLLDSAAVAGHLWREGLTSGTRQQFSRWLKLSEDDCGKLLAFWTSLHDLGKATPTFQQKHTPTQTRLLDLGFSFPNIPSGDIRHHSLLSQWILNEFKDDLAITPPIIFNNLRFAIGGHHGTFHVQDDKVQEDTRKNNLGDHRWHETRRGLFLTLLRIINPPVLSDLRISQAERNAFFNVLTGFFVTADWIASQDDPFKYHPLIIPPEDYLKEIKSNHIVFDSLIHTGWLGWKPDGERPDFKALFPFPPRPLQQLVLDQASQLVDPFLMIIEAPTGCGKTEAALMTADRAIQAMNLRGCYIAMPTQATSNQMFSRTGAFLRKRYPRQAINIQLVHGNALLNEDLKAIRLAAVDDNEKDQVEGSVNALEWFLPRKRSLLANFGVGTVDQTFMSMLRTRHSFLRLFGLCSKVIIFDEVHAYDTYMLKIFTHLLAWLRSIGSSVILLSATLPRETRQSLLEAFAECARVESADAAYPRLSINDGKKIRTLSLGEFPDRELKLEKIPPEKEIWLEQLRHRLVAGGCAAVICNTVDRAQEVYLSLHEAKLVPEQDLYLLHSRMPFCWRKAQEDTILERYGKLKQEADAPRSGIVVATQIIEQSLDLDFDLMVTELAPVDLLIQRLGRLHRHHDSRFPPIRPDALKTPACLLWQPQDEDDDIPGFGVNRPIYEPAILLRTYFTLKGRDTLVLPRESDELINQVYSEAPLEVCTDDQNRKIHDLLITMKNNEEKSRMAAQNCMIGDVDYSNAFGDKVEYLQDEDQLGEDVIAATRETTRPTVKLVCLHKKDGRTFLVDGDIPFAVGDSLQVDVLEHILRSIVPVSKNDVINFFKTQPQVPAWKRSPNLRQAYVVEFENNEYLMDNKKLTLDPQRGLLID